MNAATQRVYELTRIRLRRYQRAMRASGQPNAIDYEDIASAASDAKCEFHDERPALAYTEDMQAVEAAVCSDFGVDPSQII